MSNEDDFKPSFGEPCGPWMRSFAWLPVFTYDAGTVWLRTVYKRHIIGHDYLTPPPGYWFQYKRFR